MSQGIGAVTVQDNANLAIRVGFLEDGQRQISGKLDTLISSMAGLQANRPIQFPIILTIATQLIFLVGGAVTGIVYLARNGASEELHQVDKRISAIEQRIVKPAEPVTAWSTTVTKR